MGASDEAVVMWIGGGDDCGGGFEAEVPSSIREHWEEAVGVYIGGET
jgi:hypothetical protein